jgi:thiamine transport system permease protein
VVLAHVFLNLPLATRLILLGWQSVPPTQFRLAASLNLPVTMVIERPVLRATVPGALLAVFLVCLSSFAVALTLGGGPGATTLELAIYQALRFDFSPGRAAVLALTQLALCQCAVVMAQQAMRTMPGGGQDPARWDRSHWDAPIIGAALLFIGLPIMLVVWRGLAGLPDLPSATWPAAGRSLVVALGASLVGVTLALLLAAGGRVCGLVAMLPLSVSAMALGAGIIIVAAPLMQVARLALPVAALFGGILALPFAYRAVAPALQGIRARHDRLAETLALPRDARWRLIYLPLLRAPLGFAAGLTAALSIGDLGIIALFAGAQEETLPLLLQRLMGAYRTDAAAGVALVLMALALGVFAMCDRWGRR